MHRLLMRKVICLIISKPCLRTGSLHQFRESSRGRRRCQPIRRHLDLPADTPTPATDPPARIRADRTPGAPIAGQGRPDGSPPACRLRAQFSRLRPGLGLRGADRSALSRSHRQRPAPLCPLGLRPENVRSERLAAHLALGDEIDNRCQLAGDPTAPREQVRYLALADANTPAKAGLCKSMFFQVFCNNHWFYLWFARRGYYAAYYGLSTLRCDRERCYGRYLLLLLLQSGSSGYNIATVS